VYLPFFQGGDTLEVIRRQSGYNTSSPSALLDMLLIDRWGFNSLESSRLMKQIVVPLFLAVYLWQVWRVRGTVAGLVERSVAVLFLLMLIATWWFWPWYVIWIVPMAALLPQRGAALIAISFSASAMLMYAAYFWLLYGDGLRLQASTAGVAFLPPVLIAVAYLTWRAVDRRIERRRAMLLAYADYAAATPVVSKIGD